MQPDALEVSFAEQLATEGWAVADALVPLGTIDELTSELTPLLSDDASRGGLRLLLDLPSVHRLARSKAVRQVAVAALGQECFAVRGILFDKTPDANWKVIWHQDLTIAVRSRLEVRGFNAWSEKEGVPHVQPPVHILERMVAVRACPRRSLRAVVRPIFTA